MRRRLNLLLVIIIMIPVVLRAQISDVVSSIELTEAVENQPVQVLCELINPSQITAAVLLYRNFGESEFTQVDMEIRGSSLTGSIPANDVLVPSIEYYIVFTTVNGEIETYPENSPDQRPPERIQVRAKSQQESEVLILSPPEGETVPFDELFISISLLRVPDTIDVKASKLYVNGQDHSDKILIADDLILFYPENFPGTLTSGNQFLKLELYNSDGSLYTTASRSFITVPRGTYDQTADLFQYDLEITGETRNEQFDKKGSWYNNLETRFKSSYEDWDFGAHLYITSEEKSYRQPQNRFSVNIESDWLSVTGGDAYPNYPNLIMSGKRLRGISGELNLGFFNLQASYGQIRRSIEGELLETYARDEVVFGSNIIEIDSSKYGLPIGKVNLGTFDRNLTAIRPSLKAGETFEFGLSFLHSKDDLNSIEFGNKPKENLVFGTDFGLNLDDRRIQINGEAAFNLYNSNIANGTLADSEIDSIFGKGEFIDTDPEDVKDIKNILGKFITVNQFLGPWNPEKLSTFAAEASVLLRYFNNNFRVRYIYRGNDFQSFGQSFIKTDVTGFNFVDRVSLLRNKLFLSIGYERLTDNLQDTKPATSTFQTLNTSVSVYPGGDLPNFTIGYSRYDNENVLSAADSSFYTTAINDLTNKFYTQVSYNFTYSVPHRASFNISTSSKSDETLRGDDASSTSISGSISSEWNNKVQSHLGIIYYTSETAITPYDYSSFKFGGTFKMLENKLELRAALSPSFGDFERQTLDLVGNYRLLENMYLTMQFRIYRIPDQATNSVIGLTTRLIL